MTIEWQNKYSVKVEEIDNQHKELVDTIDKLFQILGIDKDEKKLLDIFLKLEKYAVDHFATEEKYFEKFKYNGAEEHIKEHELFKKKVLEIKNKYLQNKKSGVISFELADFLEDWLLDHLVTMDQKYVECFQKNGLK
jgi:hemerythrin